VAIFDQYTIPPTAGQLELLRYLLVLTYAVLFPFLAMVAGATQLSLFFNVRDRDIANSTFARIAKDLMDMVVARRSVVVVLGVLPLLVIWLIHGQWLSGATVPSLRILPVGLVTTALAFIPLMAYRSSLDPKGRNSINNLGLGGLGFLMLVLGTYVTVGAITRFNDPERWPLQENAIRMMLSFNIIWRHAVFMASGLAFAGCGLLLFFFEWPGCKPISDTRYATFLKNFGAGVGMAASMLIPVVLLFHTVTTPLVGVSDWFYGIYVAIVAVLFVAFVLLFTALVSPRPRSAMMVFVLFLIVFTLTGVNDQLALVNATREHSAGLATRAEEMRAQIAMEREKQRGGGEVDLARGKEVFETICSTCHRLDERLVGPPLNTVLPNYAANPDDLVSFIQSPSKKNPDYPPMPAPGLSLADTRSVAAFLLGQSAPPQEPAPETTPETTPEETAPEH
jgi:cytochrome c